MRDPGRRAPYSQEAQDTKAGSFHSVEEEAWMRGHSQTSSERMRRHWSGEESREQVVGISTKSLSSACSHTGTEKASALPSVLQLQSLLRALPSVVLNLEGLFPARSKESGVSFSRQQARPAPA